MNSTYPSQLGEWENHVYIKRKLCLHQFVRYLLLKNKAHYSQSLKGSKLGQELSSDFFS